MAGKIFDGLENILETLEGYENEMVKRTMEMRNLDATAQEFGLTLSQLVMKISIIKRKYAKDHPIEAGRPFQMDERKAWAIMERIAKNPKSPASAIKAATSLLEAMRADPKSLNQQETEEDRIKVFLIASEEELSRVKNGGKFIEVTLRHDPA